uniref:VP1 n=1 Tax=Human parvovirus B19 TaxID=10798 RepID=Q3KTM3_PAVHB|nr:VP1 [Human parvovirus B19]
MSKESGKWWESDDKFAKDVYKQFVEFYEKVTGTDLELIQILKDHYNISLDNPLENPSSLFDLVARIKSNLKDSPDLYSHHFQSHGQLSDHPHALSPSSSHTEPRGENAVLSSEDLHKPGQVSIQLPGTNYVGPGNELQAGPPQSAVDSAARIHDFRYSQLAKLGINPYTYWTVADEELLKNIKNETGFQAQAVKDYFTLKGAAAPVAHFQGSLPEVPAYNASEKYPSMTSVNSAEASTGAGGGGSNPVKSMWSEGATFTANSVTCTFSRQFLIPYDPEHHYKVFSPAASSCHNASGKEAKVCTISPIMGYSTPWRYLDFNALNLFFSPLEFQHLIENYGSIAPDALTVTISEIAVKDVTDKTGGGVQVTDSTTGRLCMLVDHEYKYPYVLGQGQDTLAPELPIWVYFPPQYAYLTVGDVNTQGISGDSKKLASEESAFYVLEHSSFELLGTGGSATMSYKFPPVPPENLEGCSQHFYEMYNPLYGSRLGVPDTLGGDPKFRSLTHEDHAIQPQNFMPGPLVNSVSTKEGDTSNTGAGKALTGLSTGTSQSTRISLRPGPVSQPYHHWDTDKYVTGINAISHGQTTYGNAEDKEYQQGVGRFPNEKEQLKQLQGLNIHTYFPNKGTQQYTDQIERPLMVGSVWNRRALHYESQLWSKIPNLDDSFKTQFAALGGWGLHQPPPQIFLKILPQSGPIGGIKSMGITTLVQYAVGIMTVTMTFKLGPRKATGRWNPQPGVYPPHAAGHLPYVLYDPTATDAKQHHRHGYEKPEELWTAKSRVHPL